MIILLDIDGVMVPAKSWYTPPVLLDGFYMFNPKSVEALNLILEKSQANIILTTSHKHSFSLDQWITIFNNRGVKISTLDRLALNDNHLTRYEEIMRWYDANSSEENFVIIDDDKRLNELPPALKERFILTKTLIGLTKVHVNEALRILGVPLP